MVWDFAESYNLGIPEVKKTIFEVEYMDFLGGSNENSPNYISVDSDNMIEFVDDELVETINKFYELEEKD